MFTVYEPNGHINELGLFHQKNGSTFSMTKVSWKYELESKLSSHQCSWFFSRNRLDLAKKKSLRFKFYSEIFHIGYWPSFLWRHISFIFKTCIKTKILVHGHFVSLNKFMFRVHWIMDETLGMLSCHYFPLWSLIRKQGEWMNNEVSGSSGDVSITDHCI